MANPLINSGDAVLVVYPTSNDNLLGLMKFLVKEI